MFKFSLVIALALTSSFAFSKTISAYTCSLGVVNLNGSLYDDAKKQAVVEQLDAKGYHSVIVTNLREAAQSELTLDTSLDCTPTYFGFASKTQVRLVENATDKILARAESPLVVEIFACKIELAKAIAELPACSLK